MAKTLNVSFTTKPLEVEEHIVPVGWRVKLTLDADPTKTASQVLKDVHQAVFPDLPAGGYTLEVALVTQEGGIIGAPVAVPVVVPIGGTYTVYVPDVVSFTLT